MPEPSRPEPSHGPLIFDRMLLRARAPPRRGLGSRRHFCSIASPPISPSGSAAVLRRFDLALDLGTPGEAVRAALAGFGSVGTVISAACRISRKGRTAQRASSSPTRRRCRSATPRSISSFPALALQFVNDLPGTLVQIRRALQARRFAPRRARSAATR